MGMTENKGAELKPCPWCGAQELSFRDGETHRWGIAECTGCGARCGESRREYPDTGAWHSDAIAAWNTRATQPAAPAVPHEVTLLRRICKLEAALEKAIDALAGGLWDFGPGQDEHAQCEALLQDLRITLATVEQATPAGHPIGALIEGHLRARDAGHTPGTTNWAMTLLSSLKEATGRVARQPETHAVDEAQLQRMVDRGTKAWADVPDAQAWVDEIRGNEPAIAAIDPLLAAARAVLDWTEHAHRPPVRDQLEVGRMASVRLHALADLHRAVQAFDGLKAEPVSGSPATVAAGNPASAPARPSNCRHALRDSGKPYPRTCAACGLGPCKGSACA